MSENPGEDTEKPDEFLWKVLGRFDHYIGAADAKAGVIATLSTFIIGGVFLRYERLVQTASMKGLVVFAMVLVFLSLGAATISLFPSLLSSRDSDPDGEDEEKDEEGGGSLIFFGDVAEREDSKDYRTDVAASDEESRFRDLADQVHTVGWLTDRKFTSLQWAYGLLGAGLAVFCLAAVVLILQTDPATSDGAHATSGEQHSQNSRSEDGADTTTTK